MPHAPYKQIYVTKDGVRCRIVLSRRLLCGMSRKRLALPCKPGEEPLDLAAFFRQTGQRKTACLRARRAAQSICVASERAGTFMRINPAYFEWPADYQELARAGKFAVEVVSLKPQRARPLEEALR